MGWGATKIECRELAPPSPHVPRARGRADRRAARVTGQDLDALRRVDDQGLELRCGGCRVTLTVCTRCYRGQLYCNACRGERRRASRRRAQRRHRATPRVGSTIAIISASTDAAVASAWAITVPITWPSRAPSLQRPLRRSRPSPTAARGATMTELITVTIAPERDRARMLRDGRRGHVM